MNTFVLKTVQGTVVAVVSGVLGYLLADFGRRPRPAVAIESIEIPLRGDAIVALNDPTLLGQTRDSFWTSSLGQFCYASALENDIFSLNANLAIAQYLPSSIKAITEALRAAESRTSRYQVDAIELLLDDTNLRELLLSAANLGKLDKTMEDWQSLITNDEYESPVVKQGMDEQLAIRLERDLEQRSLLSRFLSHRPTTDDVQVVRLIVQTPRVIVKIGYFDDRATNENLGRLGKLGEAIRSFNVKQLTDILSNVDEMLPEQITLAEAIRDKLGACLRKQCRLAARIRVQNYGNTLLTVTPVGWIQLASDPAARSIPLEVPVRVSTAAPELDPSDLPSTITEMVNKRGVDPISLRWQPIARNAAYIAVKPSESVEIEMLSELPLSEYVGGDAILKVFDSKLLYCTATILISSDYGEEVLTSPSVRFGVDLQQDSIDRIRASK